MRIHKLLFNITILLITGSLHIGCGMETVGGDPGLLKPEGQSATPEFPDHDKKEEDEDLTDEGSAPEGLIGGHFDLDTSSSTYEFSEGSTDKHVHEYDKKYEVAGADFFDLHEQDLGEINEIIKDKDQKFVLIVANAELSQGGMLNINGEVMNALQYQNNLGNFSDLKTYSLSGVDGSEKLSSLKIFFEESVIKNGGLVPTETKCVKENQKGSNGEYRNGALLIQALSADSFKIDPVTGTAKVNNGGLLWEGLVFWHKKGAGCN